MPHIPDWVLSGDYVKEFCMKYLDRLHSLYEPPLRPTHFALHWSDEQYAIILRQDIHFIPNTYKHKPYTEMRTGLSLAECKSNFADATTVFEGTMQDYEAARVAGEIVYFPEK